MLLLHRRRDQEDVTSTQRSSRRGVKVAVVASIILVSLFNDCTAQFVTGSYTATALQDRGYVVVRELNKAFISLWYAVLSSDGSYYMLIGY